MTLFIAGGILVTGVAIFGFLSGMKSAAKHLPPEEPSLAQEFSPVKRDWAPPAQGVDQIPESNSGQARAVPDRIPRNLGQLAQELAEEIVTGSETDSEGLPPMSSKSEAELIAEHPMVRAMIRETKEKLAKKSFYGTPSYGPREQVQVYHRHMGGRFSDPMDAKPDPLCACPVCIMRGNQLQAASVAQALSTFAFDRDRPPPNTQEGIDAGGMDLRYTASPVWIHQGRVLMSDAWPPVPQ